MISAIKNIKSIFSMFKSTDQFVIDVIRYSGQNDSTLGVMFVNKEFECYTLEDEYREEKVKGETRIPEGTYEVKLRTVGGFHQKYTNHKTIGDIHEGMLWLQDVPGFEYILIHCGNTDEHTAGCILVGSTTNNNKYDAGFIGHSVHAYTKMYPKVLDAIKSGKKVVINVRDLQL